MHIFYMYERYNVLFYTYLHTQHSGGNHNICKWTCIINNISNCIAPLSRFIYIFFFFLMKFHRNPSRRSQSPSSGTYSYSIMIKTTYAYHNRHCIVLYSVLRY